MHQALGEFTGSGASDDELSRGADSLHAAAEIAAEAGVTIAVEYLNRFEAYFLTTAADARAFVERVGHPRLRTMYDTFHAHIEEKDQGAAIRAIAPVMAHFHVSENDRGVPARARCASTTHSRPCARWATTAGSRSRHSAARFPTSRRRRRSGGRSSRASGTSTATGSR